MKFYVFEFEGYWVEYVVVGFEDFVVLMVVWVYGFGCCLDFWSVQVEVFVGEVCLVFVDLIGYVGFDKLEIEYMMEFYVCNVFVVMDVVSVECVVFVGYSMGVLVVREVVCVVFEWVCGIFVVDGILMLLLIFEQFVGMVMKCFEGDVYEENFGVFVDIFFGDFVIDEICVVVCGLMLLVLFQMVFSLMGYMYDESVWCLVMIDVLIVSFMVGKVVLLLNYCMMYVEEFLQVDYCMVEGVGYFVMFEVFEVVIQVVWDLFEVVVLQD